MTTKLTPSTSHRMVPAVDAWHLAMAFWRLGAHRAEQLKLTLAGEPKISRGKRGDGDDPAKTLTAK